MSRIGIIITGGDPPLDELRSWLPADPAVVVAADSGFDHALALGLAVDVVVGDMDSISAGGLALATSSPGVEIARHRPDKDATDTELAIAIALEQGTDHLIGIGGAGDRLDHQLGTLAAFAAAAERGVRVEMWWRSDHLDVIVGPGRWQLDDRWSTSGPADGVIVSLLPYGGAVTGVTTHNLLYPLIEATLSPFAALGVSNVAIAHDAAVVCTTGTLVIITPGVLS